MPRFQNVLVLVLITASLSKSLLRWNSSISDEQLLNDEFGLKIGISNACVQTHQWALQLMHLDNAIDFSPLNRLLDLTCQNISATSPINSTYKTNPSLATGGDSNTQTLRLAHPKILTSTQIIPTVAKEVTNQNQRRAKVPIRIKRQNSLLHVSRKARFANQSDWGKIQCTLSSILNDNCTVPNYKKMDGVTLIVEFDASPPNFVPMIPNPTPIPTLFRELVESTQPFSLILKGTIHDSDLEAFLRITEWPSVHHLSVRGIVPSTFNITFLLSFINLESLDLTENDLSGISLHNISKPLQIKILDLHNNFISLLPEKLNIAMPKLEVVHLDRNALVRLPASFRGLERLQHLNLRDNFLSEIAVNAFENLTMLDFLDLAKNQITTIDSKLFETCTQLTHLDLSFNHFTMLPETSFGTLLQLRKLFLGRLRLKHLYPFTFQNNTNLRELQLQHNELEVISPTVTASLTQLIRLNFAANHLTTMNYAIFQSMSLLQMLILSNNKLTTISSDIFSSLQNLQVLGMQDNKLRSLPEKLLQPCPQLNHLTLTRNYITMLPESFFSFSSKLHLLILGNNRLKTVTLGSLLELELLDLTNNFLSVLPGLELLKSLKTLRINGHFIGAPNLTPLLYLPKLATAEIAAHHSLRARFLRVDASVLLSWNASNLKVLDVQNLILPPEFNDSSLYERFSLSTLRMGWPAMGDNAPPFHSICEVLAPNVDEFSLTATSYRKIDLCKGKRLNGVFLQSNKYLEELILYDGVKQLNVSGCKKLSKLKLPVAEILDVSFTNLPQTSAFCDIWGRQMLFARGLRNDDFNSASTIQELLERCLSNVDVIDLSDNTWMNKPVELSSVLTRPTLLSTFDFRSEDFSGAVRSRKSPTVLTVARTPISCNLNMLNERVRPVINIATVVTQVAYRYNCQCSSGYRLGSGGRCVIDRLSTAELAGIVVGSSILGALLAFGIRASCLKYRRSRAYRKLLEEENELNRLLLDEQKEQVEAMKEGWRIGYEELRLFDRIDVESPGAFGKVWSAEWDSLIVAVKQLKHNLMLLDEASAEEFQHEVEFLRTTRHPHVVRFFGAGTTPEGVPFLVLELVALGSLQKILRNDIAAILEWHHSKQDDRNDQPSEELEVYKLRACELQQGDSLCAVSDTITSAYQINCPSGTRSSVLETNSSRRSLFPQANIVEIKHHGVWGFKVQICADVASGMAYLHSRGIAHR